MLRALALLFSSFLCSTIAEAAAIVEVQRSSVGATVLHLSLLFHRSRSFRHGQRPPAPSAIHANVVDIFFTSHQSVHVSTMGLSANIFPSSRIEYLRELSSVGQSPSESLNDALKEEIQHLKVLTGQTIPNDGPMMNFPLSFGANQQFYPNNHPMHTLLTLQQFQQLQIHLQKQQLQKQQLQQHQHHQFSQHQLHQFQQQQLRQQQQQQEQHSQQLRASMHSPSQKENSSDVNPSSKD
ncbi:unnamed protein product [Camellia sinensis]